MIECEYIILLILITSKLFLLLLFYHLDTRATTLPLIPINHHRVTAIDDITTLGFCALLLLLSRRGSRCSRL